MRKWWQKKVELIKIDKLLCDLMKEYANTPLDKRKTGWDWLLKAKRELEKF